ncbi:MAG: hypothetical protein IJV15_08045 [Lachnospiraceae bacterium]|nr:hypothetical protein [Lachnospiraceae bacterium]
MADFIGLNVLMLAVLLIRILAGDKISKRLRYAFWLVIPVFMLVSPFVDLKSPIQIEAFFGREIDSDSGEDKAAPDIEDYDTDNSNIQNFDIESLGVEKLNNEGADTDIYSDNQNISAADNTGLSNDRYNDRTGDDNNDTYNIDNNKNADNPDNVLEISDNPSGNISYVEVDTTKRRNDTRDKIIRFTVKLFKTIWLVSSITIFICILIYNLGFIYYCRKKRSYYETDKKTGMKIYQMPNIESPFLLGRSIYINPDMLEDDSMYHYAVTHEYCHFKHGDAFWSVIKYIVFSIYWFDPLVWLCLSLVHRDSELACDEEVIKEVGEEYKNEYGETLIRLLATADKGSRYFNISTAMNGKKSMIKERIENISKRKNHKKAVAVITVICLVLMTGCSMINPFVKEKSNEQSDATEQDGNSGIIDGEVDREDSNKGDIKDDNASDNADNNAIDTNDSSDTENLTVYITDSLENLNSQKDIESSYVTDIYNCMNHYWIDEDGILWGTGQNDCGQLGINNLSDINNLDHTYDEPVKIAEDVRHITADINGTFLIYVTNDHKLYGLGANNMGVLMQEVIENESLDPALNIVYEPYLLMEDVVFASAGQGNVCAIKDNGDLYWWGTIRVTTASKVLYSELSDWSAVIPMMYEDEPKLMLHNVRYAVSGTSVAAAIDEDNNLWLWGNNTWGQCAQDVTENNYSGEESSDNSISYQEMDFITDPVKVAADVEMVWADSLTKGQNSFDIADWESKGYRINPYAMISSYDYNVFIRKTDGQMMACGIDIGEDTKTAEIYGDIGLSDENIAEFGEDFFTHRYSTEFLPITVREYTDEDNPIEVYEGEGEVIFNNDIE